MMNKIQFEKEDKSKNKCPSSGNLETISNCLKIIKHLMTNWFYIFYELIIIMVMIMALINKY